MTTKEYKTATTKEYRTEQFKRVATKYHEYKPKIKVIKPDGETNWLDIEEAELEQIVEILTGKEGGQ